MPFFFVVLTIAVILTAYAALRGAPLAITSKVRINEIIRSVDPKPNEFFYELGTGTGRVISAFARSGKIKCVGFELSPFFYIISVCNLVVSGGKSWRMRFTDFYRKDLSEADILFFFLMPNTIEKLKSKLIKEAKKGARIVSFAFPIAGWKPYKIVKGGGKPAVYFYETLDKNR